MPDSQRIWPHLTVSCMSCMLLAGSMRAVASNLSTVIPLKAAAFGTSYDLEIVFGDQLIYVTADTGSSDLWVLTPDWTCHLGDPTTSGPTVSRGKCLMGNQTYTPSSTFKPIANAWLGEHYGAGNVVGTLGYENVGIGSITIPDQEMGVVNATTEFLDGFSGGTFGLGYPDIASVHPENYTASTALQLIGDRLLYPTVLTRMTGLGVEPYFSLALERTPRSQEVGFGGYIAFGTLPPVAHGDFATVPVEITKAIPISFTNGTREITEWALTVQAVSWNGKTSSEPFQAVVDSGNWLNVLPEAIAKEINAAFDPPAVVQPGQIQSFYSVPCNATPPAGFGIQLGGTMFSIESADLIYQSFEGKCYSSIAPVLPADGISLMFLGDAFLKNVVAVFDFGHDEMRFAPRRGSNASASGSGPPLPYSTGAGSLIGVQFGAWVSALIFELLYLL